MFNIVVDTCDHQHIAAVHYKEGHRNVIVLAHGFFNNKDVYLFQKIAKELSRHYDVVVFDFRGHGKSSGLFMWTSRESADIQAVLGYVKGQGYEKVGLMGFSLGAATCLIEASRNKDIEAVIAVSAPSDFWKINYRFWEQGMWEDLKLNLGSKGKGKGVRPGNPFESKTPPIDVVAAIAPRPVLFIHGSKDWLIRSSHSEALFMAAKDPKKIEIIQGAGHAEKIFDDYPDVFMKVCLDWFSKYL